MAPLYYTVISISLSAEGYEIIHDVFNMISSRRDEINFYVSLFDLVADFPANSERLREIQNRMLVADNDARQQINKLGTLVWFANMRRNGILFIIYLVFEFLFFCGVQPNDDFPHEVEAWLQHIHVYNRRPHLLIYVVISILLLKTRQRSSRTSLD